MTEQDAIKRMKRGDMTGLEMLVERYQHKALRTAILITRDKALAEDVVQSTFIRIYKRIHQYDESRPFAPYFLKSVANASVQAVKKQNRVLSLNTEISEGEGDTTFEDLLTDDRHEPSKAVESAEQKEMVREALGKLSPEQRAVMVLRYYLDMSESDMSEELETPVGTIKWRLHEARKRLRGLLKRTMMSSKKVGGYHTDG